MSRFHFSQEETILICKNLLLRHYDRLGNFGKRNILRQIKKKLWQRFRHCTSVLELQRIWSDIKRCRPRSLKTAVATISDTADGHQAVVCLVNERGRRTATLRFVAPGSKPLERLQMIEETNDDDKWEQQEATHPQAHCSNAQRPSTSRAHGQVVKVSQKRTGAAQQQDQRPSQAHQQHLSVSQKRTGAAQQQNKPPSQAHQQHLSVSQKRTGAAQQQNKPPSQAHQQHLSVSQKRTGAAQQQDQGASQAHQHHLSVMADVSVPFLIEILRWAGNRIQELERIQGAGPAADQPLFINVFNK